MPNAFTLFGKLEIGTSEFENSLKSAESRLKSTQKAVTDQENQVKTLGGSTAATARSYEKLNDMVNQSRARLAATTEAFTKGTASASQMRSALLAVEKSAESASSKLKDTAAKMADMKPPSDLSKFSQVIAKVKLSADEDSKRKSSKFARCKIRELLRKIKTVDKVSCA